MEQLCLFDAPVRSCAFTGHRVLGEDFKKEKLERAIDAVLKAGARTFYNGLAQGFDLLAAEILLNRKKSYPDLRLIGCIPFPNQSKSFSLTEKKQYEKIFCCCDETVLLSETYTKYCFHTRNRYMCDHADALISYCNQKTGGSAYTKNYFIKKIKGKLIEL